MHEMDKERVDIAARIDGILGQYPDRLVNKDTTILSANGKKCEQALLALIRSAIRPEGGADDPR